MEAEKDGLKCRHVVGCHACPLDHLQDDFRLFRYALEDLIKVLPDGETLVRRKARSIITQMNCWIEPRGG